MFSNIFCASFQIWYALCLCCSSSFQYFPHHLLIPSKGTSSINDAVDVMNLWAQNDDGEEQKKQTWPEIYSPTSEVILRRKL